MILLIVLLLFCIFARVSQDTAVKQCCINFFHFLVPHSLFGPQFANIVVFSNQNITETRKVFLQSFSFQFNTSQALYNSYLWLQTDEIYSDKQSQERCHAVKESFFLTPKWKIFIIMGTSFFIESIKDCNYSLGHKAQKLERVVSINKVLVDRNEADNKISKVFNLKNK